jgi:hypothetical protein
MPGTFPRKQLGMNQVSQKFDAVDNPRAGTGEIRIRIDGKNTALRNRGDLLPIGQIKKPRHLG